MSNLPEMTPVKYVKPTVKHGKALVKLCRTDRMIGIIQVLAKGGETNLHSHQHMDGLWFVLSGTVRFYGENNKIIGDFGKYEGVLVPRGCPYWFEAVGDQEAEIMQLEAFDQPFVDDTSLHKDRIDYEKRNRPMEGFTEASAVKA